jgi:hypothetical protein
MLFWLLNALTVVVYLHDYPTKITRNNGYTPKKYRRRQESGRPRGIYLMRINSYGVISILNREIVSEKRALVALIFCHEDVKFGTISRRRFAVKLTDVQALLQAEVICGPEHPTSKWAPPAAPI